MQPHDAFWAINSRADFKKAVPAIIRAARSVRASLTLRWVMRSSMRLALCPRRQNHLPGSGKIEGRTLHIAIPCHEGRASGASSFSQF